MPNTENAFESDTVRDVSSVFDHWNKRREATLSSIQLLVNDNKVFELRTMEANIKKTHKGNETK